MSDWFEQPAVLLAGLPLAAALAWWYRSQARGRADRRLRWRLIWRAAGLACLILALAGLRLPGEVRAVRVVAAVDVSASIYDPSAQQAELETLARELHGSNVELGVVVFGRTAGLERAVAPLPLSVPPGAERGTLPAAGPPPVPDVTRPQAAVEREGTDLARALRLARAQLGDAQEAARAIVLLSDGLDTAGGAEEAAAALAGSGIDLLARPAAMEAHGDVHVASLRHPERGRVGLGLPLDVTVAGQQAARVRVRVRRHAGGGVVEIGARIVELQGRGDARRKDFRATATLIDRPALPGLARYEAVVDAPEGGALPGDFTPNNTLWAALPIDAPAKWAVLTRERSPLALWARDGARPLGVDAALFTPERLPKRAQDFAGFTGVLVDGLDASELPEGEALQALAAAVEQGLSLVAVGGEAAFGAGRHAEGGAWERLLPATLRPEDDRRRSILFVMDISASMKIPVQPRGDLKLNFARAQLGEAVGKLRATDRVGLIVFSREAQLLAALDADPSRTGMVTALNGLKEGMLGQETNFVGALAEAKRVLESDDAEERLVVLLSDGEPTPPVPDAELEAAVRALCPPPAEATARWRTRLFAFGIGTNSTERVTPGEARLKRMALAGGGQFFPEFLQLAKRLQEVFDERREDLYTRHGPFGVQTRGAAHEIVAAAGEPWPVLPFRNRVKPRPESEALLWSAPLAEHAHAAGSKKPDPLLLLGHRGGARTALLSLSLEGAAGQAFLQPKNGWRGGRALLAAAMSWCEGEREASRAGWRLEAEPLSDDRLELTLYARAVGSQAAQNEGHYAARLRPLDETRAPAPGDLPLRPVAPGTFRAEAALPPPGVYRMEVRDAAGGAALAERLVAIPYPQEFRRFGTDRLTLEALVDRAGGHSRMIHLPAQDLAAWREACGPQRAFVPVRGWLLVLAAVCVLAEVAARGLRAKRTS